MSAPDYDQIALGMKGAVRLAAGETATGDFFLLKAINGDVTLGNMTIPANNNYDADFLVAGDTIQQGDEVAGAFSRVSNAAGSSGILLAYKRS